MSDRHGIASWPGVQSVYSCQYTTSQGISPGIANLITLPQAVAPPETGTLIIGDGSEKIVLPDCKVDKLVVNQMNEGFVWSLTIVDRRWKWKDLGVISGAYNQLDPHGKLIPWTIRSPQELALLCLKAMGEPVYDISDLPDGFNSGVGALAYQLNPPWIGVTPTTSTNPPINWYATPPAQALANLCELFGRRVVLRWSDNRVLITQPAVGADLPAGSIAKLSPAINAPETPAGVMVIGAPTIYQDRLPLEPVGEDWDGSYRPLNQLSYAPIVPRQPQITNIIINDPLKPGSSLSVEINGRIFDIGAVAVGQSSSSYGSALNGKVVAWCTGQGIRITITTPSADRTVLTFNGFAGVPFGIAIDKSPEALPGSFILDVVQVAGTGGPNWNGIDIPTFWGVQATQQLTHIEAVRLAQKSVMRCYRLCSSRASNVPPEDSVPGDSPWRELIGQAVYVINGYGPIARRQQIILRSTQAAQVVPTPVDAQVRDREGNPLTLNFYNGYSRDKPAAVYGSVSVHLTGPFFIPSSNNLNTPAAAQVHETFSVDATEQLIMFSRPLYYNDPQLGCVPATLTLETGFFIRNADTNQTETFVATQALPGASGNTNYAARVYDDVQFNVIANYDAGGNFINVTLLEADPINRSQYYLDGMAAQYFTAAGSTVQYNGIRAIDLDGAIMQLSWEIGPGGAKTTASRNTEHAVWVPPYPARRRAEFLNPANLQRLQQNANPPNVVMRDLRTPDPE